MTKRLWFVVGFVVIFSGCGKLKDIFDLDDEMSGGPVRQVPNEEPEEPAPYPPNRKIYSSVGFYAKGFLWSRDEVVSNTLWFVRPRTVKVGHNFASIYVTDLMRQATQAYYRAEPTADMIEIWDISNSGGGKSGGHVSHQIGLDIDIRYPYVAGSDRSMDSIDYPKFFSLLKAWVDTGEVRRVFVDKKIKEKICEMYSVPHAKEYLRRLRPYRGHHDHAHFRIKCPKEESKCVDQTEVPDGSGC
jgi:penicillin-insensitive murein endopeptidase